MKIAGGFFTKYLNNNYAQLFPDFKVYFDRTKDIDVYYVNKKKRKTYNGEIYGNFYSADDNKIQGWTFISD